MSNALFSAAKKVIPGGVNSPVRAFGSVGGTPFFIKRAKGPYLFSSTDQRYIDYVGAWGAMILGHAHPTILNAVRSAIKNGLSFGAPTEIETKMAHKICALMPAIEKIRMVNSGTEATMSAIRLARAYTGRKKIIKFSGCYHGHVDALLVKAGSGALALGVPTSPGIPVDLAQHTIVLNYNNTEQVKSFFQQRGEQIAAVIVEPVAGNMNCIPGTHAFLKAIKRECNKYQSLLIFDEVMSGFRVALGGAQSIYHIKPDLTTLGKVIGGGMPVGAFGGREEIMDHIAPDGPVYQAGTLSGNPITMAAGLATLKLISAPGYFQKITDKTKNLLYGLASSAAKTRTPFTTNQAGAMFGLFFTKDKKVCSLAQVMRCDQQRFKKFFRGMLAAGIYLAPSPFEAGFVSSAHTDTNIAATISAAEKIMYGLKT